MNSTVEYIFKTLFGLDCEKVDENSKKFDIFEYSLNLRKVFYKLYPTMIEKYKNLSKIFSSKDLERAIISDEELTCIPMDLIDPNVIQTKVFGKLLSQDYDILNKYIEIKAKDSETKNILKNIKYVINYADVEFNGMKIHNNIMLYCELFGSINVIDAFVQALNIIPASEVVKYIESEHYSQINTKAREIIINRYFRNESFDNELWNLCSNNVGKARLFMMIVYNNYNVIKNDISEVVITSNEMRTLSMSKFDVCEYLLQFLEYNILHDEYKGDWILVSPSDLDYNLYEVDNVNFKFNEDGVKMRFDFNKESSIGFHVTTFLEKHYIIDYKRLTSLILLSEVIKYKISLMCLFDVYEFNVQKCILEQCDIFNLHYAFNYELKITVESKKIFEQMVSNSKYHSLKVLRIFDIHDNDVMNAIVDACTKNQEFKKFIIENIKIFFNKVNENLSYISNEFVDFMVANYDAIKYKFMNQMLSNVIVNDYIFETLSNICIDIVYIYLSILIDRKELKDDFLKMCVEKYINNETAATNNRLADLGIRYIYIYKQEPPLILYPNPNFKDSSHGMNAYEMWCEYINVNTVPREMTNESFYEYMIKYNGYKKNPNNTSCYTFFSNSLENKIIFIKSDTILNSPAVLKFDIPVEYDKLKVYLLEGIETNNICMFSSLNDNDFTKIAGGNYMLDCVVLSDSKNIYRERTPLRNVIQYLISSIEIEYNIKLL